MYFEYEDIEDFDDRFSSIPIDAFIRNQELMHRQLFGRFGGIPNNYGVPHKSTTSTDADSRGISLNPFNSRVSELSKYYNKEEKKGAFSNITIKVQTQTYHLNKAMLALTSGYFEKLLINCEKEGAEIEMHTIDENTFSLIVEKIYGTEFTRYGSYATMKDQNFAALFMAMDFLQMEIDLKTFQSFISSLRWQNIEKISTSIFQLHDFVSPLPKFEPMLCSLRQFFSENLREVSKMPEFPSLSPAAFIEILIPSDSRHRNSDSYRDEQNCIAKICAEWICHDFQHRLPRIIDLVNAVKYRYGFNFAISSENYKTFDEPNELKRKKTVEKYFHELLNGSVELTTRLVPVDAERSKEKKTDSGKTPANKIDYEAKWKTFFERKSFTDVSIRVGEEVFHLHRIKLSLEVPYFRDLFSQSTIQKEYSLDAAIDCDSFRKIVNYIYYEEIDVLNESHLGRLLEACDILSLKKLSEDIFDFVCSNFAKMKNNFIDFLDYVLKNDDLSEIRQNFECTMCLLWDEIVKESKFYEITFAILEHLINLPDFRLKNEQDLLKVCSKWVHHDLINRYKLIPQLALVINRNSMKDHENYSSPLPEDFSTCSEQHVLERLNNILSLTQPVSFRTRNVDGFAEPQRKPCFMTSKSNKISILDENFVEIFSLSAEKEFKCTNLSAAVIEDNLFMLFYENGKFSFQVYNQTLKKIISLMFNSKNASSNFCLLNCNKSLYFCPTNDGGEVLKYSCQLNRWIVVFEKEERNRFQQYTSDGKVLCKVFNESYHQYRAQLYNFEKQSWINFPSFPNETEDRYIRDVTIINEKLSALFNSSTAIYRQKTRRWEIIARKNEEFVAFKQVKDSILYVTRAGQVYSFSIAGKSWKLVKKLEGVKKIVAIHSVNE